MRARTQRNLFYKEAKEGATDLLFPLVIHQIPTIWDSIPNIILPIRVGNSQALPQQMAFTHHFPMPKFWLEQLIKLYSLSHELI